MAEFSAPPADATVEELWETLLNRMQTWDQHGTTIDRRPPVTEAALGTLAAAIGRPVPEDLVTLLRVNDGTFAGHDGPVIIYPPLLSAKQMAEQYGEMMNHQADPYEGFAADPAPPGADLSTFEGMWHASFLPFAECDGAGHFLSTDTGAVGHWDHDGWWFESRGESLRSFLADCTTDYGSGCTARGPDPGVVPPAPVPRARSQNTTPPGSQSEAVQTCPSPGGTK